MLADVGLELAFRLRGALPWSPRPRAASVDVAAVRAGLDDAGRARFDVLADDVDVAALAAAVDVAAAREALWAADALDRLLGRWRPVDRCLDVGAKNGVLLPGQVAFHPGPWTLVELDGHRRYVDGTTRGAHARAAAARFVGCKVVVDDVNAVAGSFGLITWFLPFVVPSPHRAWGLPRRFFQPRRTLRHVLSLLGDGGALVIVNQGAHEAAAQRALLRDVVDDDGSVDVREHGALSSTLSPYRWERHAFVVRRR